MRPGRGQKFGTVKTVSGEYEIVESLGRIDFGHLALEVEETGAEVLWWGEVAAKATRRANDLERQMDYVQADLRRKVRAGATARLEKMTVDAVDDEVTVHPVYQQAIKDYHAALEDAQKSENAKFTIARKQEQLQGYASRVLAELAALGPPMGAPVSIPTRRAVRQ